MEQVLPYVPLIIFALACPIGMGAAMWLMMRRGNQQMPMGSMPTLTLEQHLVALQSQKEMLEKEIREMETVQTLQERHASLQREATAPSEQI